MDDAVRRYRERRDARLKKRMDEGWITIKGTHVLVDDDKQITKGPEKLRNRNERWNGASRQKETGYERNGGRASDYIDFFESPKGAQAVKKVHDTWTEKDNPNTSDNDFEKEGFRKNKEGIWERRG